MEELIGKAWHRLVCQPSQHEHEDARIHLTDLNWPLTLFYRGLGGNPGKKIVPAYATRFRHKRRLIQRIAGTDQKHTVAWQDEEYINLPPSIACFTDATLNTSLYYWLIAMSAKLPSLHHWFEDNQRTCAELLQERPGLKKTYQKLVKACIDSRPPLSELQAEEYPREAAIQNALLNPTCINELPPCKGDPFPVWLWLYPSPLRPVSSKTDDQLESGSNKQKAQHDSSESRKQAQRIDDSKQTDGLIVFQAESLFSWSEQADLDRSQIDDMDDDLVTAAEDLDIITVSRQRRSGMAKLKFDLDLPAAENDDLPLGEGIRLPEWDYRKSKLVEDYCLLQPMLADTAEPCVLPEHLSDISRSLKKRFSILRTQRSWQRRQTFGDEIDLDAWLQNMTQPVRDINRQDYYQSQITNQRDIACLLLADLSMSTDAMISEEKNVIDIIRDTLLLFAEAMTDSGDQLGIYGFSSVKNTQVRYHILKNFKESYNDLIRGRIMATRPGFYTRMGAAIRQSTQILKTQAAKQRILIVISDGKPNDIDQYEGRYGIEDTRRAIIEAKQQGLQPFCITIDNRANDYLSYLFGDNGFSIVNDVSKLPLILPRQYLKLTTLNT